MWYRDEEHYAYRKGGAIIRVRIEDQPVYPRGRFEQAVMMVRSLDDIAAWTNVDRVVAQAGDVVHMEGEEGSCLAIVVQSAEHRVIQHGAGLNPSPWVVRVEGLAIVSSDHPALTMLDIEMPA